MSQSIQDDKTTDTVPVRLPRELWKRIRQRALERGESGLAYLSRCAEVCLGVAGTGESKGGVTASAVEPREDLSRGKTTGGAGGKAAGDLEVRRGAGASERGALEPANAPVRLGQAASIPGVAPVPSGSDVVGERAGKASRPQTASARPGATGSVAPAQDRTSDPAWGVAAGAVTHNLMPGKDGVLILEVVSSPVCVCGHTVAAHVNGTGRCNFGNGCDKGCRKFQPADPS